jgi:hypothetical protein
MTQEKGKILGWATQERQKDLDWIEENRDIFWLVATVACELTERGAIVVELQEKSRTGYNFSYLTRGEIEIQDEKLDRLIREYDPHREFVVVLFRPEGQTSMYLEKMPQTGWWVDMRSKTPYPEKGKTV